MKVTLLIDVGSTYTKITAVDLDRAELVGRSYAVSTADTDMTVGIEEAYRKLLAQIGDPNVVIERRLACSSAAGGLRLVAIGLVPSLTGEAAKRAALGAGAKVTGVYSYRLTRNEIEKIEGSAPDIILVAGGTDGGDTEVILHNSRCLADSGLTCPMVVCGNKVAAEEVCSCLQASGKTVEVTDNVLPDLDRLNVDPCRSVVREVFINRIVHGKGLDKAQALLGGIIMPTPLAVLNAARLLAQGTDQEKGLGELIIADIGGATTDVVSIAQGHPSLPSVIEKGLPEPFAKRTVEGDLGIRHNALNILELAGKRQLLQDMRLDTGSDCSREDPEAAIRQLSSNPSMVPQEETGFLVDVALARSAVRIAVERHAGSIEQSYTPSGTAFIQRGKDLTQVRTVIGTGGVIAYGKEPAWVLAAASFDERAPGSLKPRQPQFLIDRDYILYAVGLLSEISPENALRIAKKSLLPVQLCLD